MAFSGSCYHVCHMLGLQTLSLQKDFRTDVVQDMVIQAWTAKARGAFLPGAEPSIPHEQVRLLWVLTSIGLRLLSLPHYVMDASLCIYNGIRQCSMPILHA